MISANEYFGFVTALVLAMGAVFELPILVLLLSAMGLVSPKFLSKYRRHAMVGSFVVAAFITPGDLFVTNMVLTVMLYMLYEVSIMLSWLVFRKREKKRSPRSCRGDRVRLLRAVVLMLLAWLACPASAFAQIPIRMRKTVPTGRDTIRARGDTLLRRLQQ